MDSYVKQRNKSELFSYVWFRAKITCTTSYSEHVWSQIFVKAS